MKKQIFALALLSILASFPLFAQSSLTEKFSNLSKEIIASSVRPFDRLEQLKTIFTDCSLKNKNPEIKSACAEWLSGTYQEIKEATPEQIYVELGSGDVEVKFIKSDSYGYFGTGETVNIYEVHIPKYDFSYQFYLLKETPAQVLSKWKRSKNGNIVIPDFDYGTNKKRSEDPADFIAIYSTPHLTSDSSLQEVGKEYKKVYQDVFQFNDWKSYYIRRLSYRDNGPMGKNFKTFSPKTQKQIKDMLLYLTENGPLPWFLDWYEDGENPFYLTGALDHLYGAERAPRNWFCNQTKRIDRGNSWKYKEGCLNILKKKYNISYGSLFVLWNKFIPQYIWVISNQADVFPGGIFIVK